MVLLENDVFLTELTKMFQKSRTSGSVQLTMKKYDGHDKPTPKPNKNKRKVKVKTIEVQVKTITCLIRAKLHNRKISTLVGAKDVNRFQLAYCNLLKGNMDGLKRLKKKKVKSME